MWNKNLVLYFANPLLSIRAILSNSICVVLQSYLYIRDRLDGTNSVSPAPHPNPSPTLSIILVNSVRVCLYIGQKVSLLSKKAKCTSGCVLFVKAKNFTLSSSSSEGADWNPMAKPKHEDSGLQNLSCITQSWKLATTPIHPQYLTILWLGVWVKIFQFSILFLVLMMHQPKCNHNVLFTLFENSLSFDLNN